VLDPTYRLDMHIAVIGPLEVLIEQGGPVVVPAVRERLLLAALVASAPGVVSTDRHRGDVSEAEIGPSGQLLVTLGWADRMVGREVLPAGDPDIPDLAHPDLDAWIRTVRSVVERDLSRNEWIGYLPGRPWEPTCSGSVLARRLLDSPQVPGSGGAAIA
jgi:hypothetical protein